MSGFSERLAKLVGAGVAGRAAVASGYTRADSGLVRLVDGREVFVKSAADARSAAELRAEAAVLAALAGRHAPRLLAFDDGDPPLLVSEAVSGSWPPPYPPDTSPIFAALDAVHLAEPPEALRRVAAAGGEAAWARVEQDPAPVVALGACSEAWLGRALPGLLRAEASFSGAGTALCHLDVYAANVCFSSGRAVLVDWGSAAVANPDLDLAQAAVSVVSEGGALPPGLAVPAGALAATAGELALLAAAPPPDWARDGSTLRADQLRDLRAALALAAGALDLGDPASRQGGSARSRANR